jgi:hypothetical protein
MHASSYAEEIDLKTSWFCPACLTAMRTAPALLQGKT